MANRGLAKVNIAAKGVASGIAGFMDFRKSFEDAIRKHKWEKERQQEEDRLKRQETFIGAGGQPENWGQYLATGNMGQATMPSSPYNIDNIPLSQNDLPLKQIRFTKIGNRLVGLPTYGQPFELSSTVLDNIMTFPEQYGLTEKDTKQITEWIKKQVGGITGATPKAKSDNRQKAMDYLKANNAPITEKNIQYIIDQL